MAAIENTSRENWLDLHLLIDEYFTHYNGYIFRGQADVKWSLDSTLSRAIRQNYPPDANINAIVGWHLAAFKENIRGRCAVDLERVSDDALWALGQHFGLYTPLLDWSASPYVALFFALFGECRSGRRSLWAVLEDDVNEAAKTADDLKIFRPLTHDNVRLVSQRGLFLKVPVGKSADAIIQGMPDSDSVTMYRIDFPDSIRGDALAALNNMNINHASLFPDLVGSSLHTNFQLEIEPHLEGGRNHGFKGDAL